MNLIHTLNETFDFWRLESAPNTPLGFVGRPKALPWTYVFAKQRDRERFDDFLLRAVSDATRLAAVTKETV